MSDDESSFVILGSTPTPSMEQYNGHETSLTQENGSSLSSKMMQSSTQTMKNFSLINSVLMNSPSLSATNVDNAETNESLVNPSEPKDDQMTHSIIKASTASGTDFAEQFLMGEIPPDSIKYNIWKQFPSFCTSQSNAEDMAKLENLIDEHVKLKDNLQKTNDAMLVHFSTINKWQTRVKELKETQANEIDKCNETITNLQEQLRLKIVENENVHVALLERDEFNQKLKMDIVRLKEEHDEKTLQFNMNLAYAASENRDLVQDISAKTAIIQNMTNMIEQLEKQAQSFEMVQHQRDGQPSHVPGDNSLMNKSQCNSEFAAQLNAAREQNLQLLEEVSNKISKIKQLESESSKLTHQLLSLEMIVNENGQKSSEDGETVRRLKDELNQMSIANLQIRETAYTDYSQQVNQLKENLAREEERYQRANEEIQNMTSEIELQKRNLNELSAKIAEQQAELNELRKANVILRSKEINSDIQAHQKSQEFTEIKEENEFLKAQLDVYKSDFEMERQSRQDIANEREELLSDLKLLQRRNQQLIDEAQSRARPENAAGSSSSASGVSMPPFPPAESKRRQPIGKFICPVCNSASPNLIALQNHVQNCLEN